MAQLTPPVSHDDHILGHDGAAIEMVEYGDFQCSHCGEAFLIVKRIETSLGDKLKFVFRNFPLRKIHPQALAAAIAAEAAGLQGKYWEMYDMLFENQTKLDSSSLLAYAGHLGLNTDRFQADLTDKKLEAKVLSDIGTGVRSGVNGTPTFFINGTRFEGDWRSNAFVDFVSRSIRKSA